MANFIEKTLEPGEKVIFKGRLHWSYNFRYTAWGILLILLSVAGMVVIAYTHYNDFNNNMLALFCLCVVVCLVGIGLIGFGYFIRNRTEFAVTNNRFIQKDGIFDIKMTEIPLQRIETVNYYQTIWQRIIGTGCVELVGSGGTSHQVHCIEHPMQVRKMILSAINADNDKRTEATPNPPCDNDEKSDVPNT